MIPGPAGMLEVRLAPGDTNAWAILCHPHPLYGGTMDDGVLDIARSRFAAAGGGTVLFNFRGVGASDGSHDRGAGEVDDVLAVAHWLESSDHAVDALTLIGYSFGSSVAWRALPDVGAGTAGTRAVLIAPPLGSMAYPPLPDAVGAVIVGDQDPFVHADALDRWLASQPRLRRMPITGADHFFSQAPGALGDALDEVVAAL